MSGDWKDFFYTELTTGLRLEEICGLMWSDFDGRTGTLRIRRTLHKEKGRRLVVRSPKTCVGARTLSCYPVQVSRKLPI